MPNKKKKKLGERLRSKYRLVVMNDDTFEEKVKIRLSPLNFFISIATIMLTLTVLVIYLIAFTPLREYIPGYADLNMQRNVYRLTLLADSLQKDITLKNQYMENIRNVVEGNVDREDSMQAKPAPKPKTELPKSLERSKEDEELRATIESESRFDLMQPEHSLVKTSGINSFFFFTPVKGTVTNIFNSAEKHFGVDVAAGSNEAIKATLDGTVVLSTWTSETGYVIGIQHGNNLFSFYKHNSSLLKKTGAFVKAGEAIAIIGNSGEHTTGPHLHFELWYNGTAVNPSEYISF